MSELRRQRQANPWWPMATQPTLLGSPQLREPRFKGGGEVQLSVPRTALTGALWQPLYYDTEGLYVTKSLAQFRPYLVVTLPGCWETQLQCQVSCSRVAWHFLPCSEELDL